jgi:hypothetical protein
VEGCQWKGIWKPAVELSPDENVDNVYEVQVILNGGALLEKERFTISR